jgi:hypothetical protein
MPASPTMVTSSGPPPAPARRAAASRASSSRSRAISGGNRRLGRPARPGGPGPARPAARGRQGGHGRGGTEGDRPLGRPPGRLRHQHDPGRRRLQQPGRRPDRVPGHARRRAAPPRTSASPVATAACTRTGAPMPPARRAPVPGLGARPAPSDRRRVRASRMARAARTARSGSSVAGPRDCRTGPRCARRQVSSTTPPWASISARTRSSRPGQHPAGVLRVSVGEALPGLVDVDHQHGDELAFGPAGRSVAAGRGRLNRRSFRESTVESPAREIVGAVAPTDALDGPFGKPHQSPGADQDGKDARCRPSPADGAPAGAERR